MAELKVFKKLCAMSREISGFLTDREGWLLYQLAKMTREGCIVEIGSWQGKSTVWLGLGTLEAFRRKVYAIDPHTGSEEHQIPGQKIWTLEKFKENVQRAGLSDIVSPIVSLSHEARRSFDQPVGLLFIDGAHDHESVKRDYELWAPLVMDGGYIVFHDTQQIGVQRVADDVLQRHSFSKVFFEDTMCCGRKVARASWLDRLRARRMVALKNAFTRACGNETPKGRRKWLKNLIKFERALLMVL